MMADSVLREKSKQFAKDIVFSAEKLRQIIKKQYWQINYCVQRLQ